MKISINNTIADITGVPMSIVEIARAIILRSIEPGTYITDQGETITLSSDYTVIFNSPENQGKNDYLASKP
jgi:hypothetical protein